MEKTLHLPNVGIKLSKKLADAGIQSIDDMKILGAEDVFLKVKAVYNDACISSLYAIEGAIQGIRWHGLSEQRKGELREFYNQINPK